MPRVRTFAVLVALVLVGFLGVQIASAAPVAVQYHVVDLDFPIAGTPFFSLTQANGIWNGVAVGIAADSGPRVFFPRAVVWPSRSSDHVLLPSVGDEGAEAISIWHDDVVGYTGGSSEQRYGHASLWRGKEHTRVDLHPAGYDGSIARGVWEGRQAGFGVKAPLSADETWHALLWSESAGSVVDLGGGQPFFTAADAVDARHVVGMLDGHASLWSDAASTRVDLHPAGYANSEALALWGDRQVGYGTINDGSGQHDEALIWRGSRASATVLDSGGFDNARATGIAGDLIVGFGSDNTVDAAVHALLWPSPDAAPIDLHDFVAGLPEFAGVNDSRAFAIDSVTGIIAGDVDNHAVLWVPGATAIPLPPAVFPGAAALVACVGCIYRGRRRYQIA